MYVKSTLYRPTECAHFGHDQGWQYRTVHSEFANYVSGTLKRTLPAYRTSIQFLKRSVPTYRTRTITKKTYCSSLPYFWAKIEAYRNLLTYSTVLPFLLLTTRNFNWLWNQLKPIDQRSQFTHSASGSAVFCLCIQKTGAMCEQSEIFKPLRIQQECRSCFCLNFSPIYDMPQKSYKLL